jgi:hypothetical protein
LGKHHARGFGKDDVGKQQVDPKITSSRTVHEMDISQSGELQATI